MLQYRAALHEVLEAAAHAHDGAEVLLRDHDDVVAVLEGIALGQRDGRLQRVADLAAVPAQRAHVGAVPGVLARRDGDVDAAQAVSLALAGGGLALDALEAVEPDALAVGVGQGAVVQRDVDAGREGGVEGLHAVRGEEEHAAVVLERAQEDGDEPVALDVLVAPRLEVHVGLVQQHDGPEPLPERQEVLEVLLHLARLRAQVAARER